MFEHREAVLTSLGGETIAHSLIRPAHLAPCHDIRYSRCFPEPAASWCVQSENTSGGLHVWERVGWPVFEHRGAVLTSFGGGMIAHSPSGPAHLAPCHDIRYSRCLPEPAGASNPRTHLVVYSCGRGRKGWPVFEHYGAVSAPLGGGTIARSLIRPAHLAPCHDIRYSRCLPEPAGASNPRTHLAVYTRGSGSVGRFLSIMELS